MTEVIDVAHACDDGWHEFTSSQVPGLYLVSDDENLETAYYDVCNVVEALIFADYGTPVKVKPLKTFDQYMDGLPDSHRPSRRYYEIERIAA